MKYIFRNDDVNPNQDLDKVRGMYAVIRKYFPDAEIISGVNLIAKTSQDGSAYPALKPKDIDFYDVDLMFDRKNLTGLGILASHGLLHLDHRALSRDAQEISILVSCSLLDSKIFIPPFWRWNQDTIDICASNNIDLPVLQDWINLDDAPARIDHGFYCLHSWKFKSVDDFEERFRDIHKLSTA